MYIDMHSDMHILNRMKVNALELRQSLGAVLEKLKKGREPVVIEKNRRPVAVLISIETFEERFIDRQEQTKRESLKQRFRNAGSRTDRDSLETLRELRYGSGD